MISLLNEFIKQYKSAPKPWNTEDSKKFCEIFIKLTKEDIEVIKYVKKFSFTCSGY